MSWFRIAQASALNLRFRSELTGHHHGQSDMVIIAYLVSPDKTQEDMPVGFIQYVYFEDEIHISFIKVHDKFLRQGIGTRMIEYLKQENPGVKINIGMTTPTGTPFFDAMKREKVL
jgi:ribosomal protein S18 acetylase RimI-like enzyme